MIDCCELALANSRLALYITLGAFGTIALLLLMFFGYNLTLGTRTTKLEKKNGHELDRIVKLEKKNGHEQEQINQLTDKVKKLEKKLRGDKN